MQELLTQILWDSEDIHAAAVRLYQDLPGFREAQRQYDETAGQVQALVGYELFDRLCDTLARCTGYEIRAYYSLGLGLRRELVQELGL